jgi:hypothetical protein
VIRVVRGQRVILDSDLAMLYGVGTGNLNKVVNRNRRRFPSDFTFELTPAERDDVRFQVGIGHSHGRRALLRVFTAEGVAMLSIVFGGKPAACVSIEMLRAFIRLWSMLLASKHLTERMRKIEQTQIRSDREFAECSRQTQELFAAMRDMASPHRRRPGRDKFAKGRGIVRTLETSLKPAAS